MKKNGFTLIELLSVIVILALIAVITAPVTSNIIERSKIESANTGATNYLKAVESFYVERNMNLDDVSFDGKYVINSKGNLLKDSNEYVIEIRGKSPTAGFVIYENNKVKNACFYIDEYAAVYNKGEFVISKESCDNYI